MIEDAQVIRLCLRRGEATGLARGLEGRKRRKRKGTMMRRCAAAACPAGRIVDLGGVSPDEDCAPSPELLMMVLVGGRDHSPAEFRELGMRRARPARADARTQLFALTAFSSIGTRRIQASRSGQEQSGQGGPSVMMVSYAQDAEDVMLQRAFPRDYRGFYIDAGASDPVQFSVTKHFYDRGWRGINIEPVPSVWGRLRDQRPRDVNLNAGLSDREGRFTFYEVAETTWSTFSAEAVEAFRGRGLEVRPHEMPVTTLARVCEQHADAPIDVEGHELEVISGGDWVRWRPRVVLVENNGAERWEPLLLGHGYHHAVTTEINRYYIRDEDRSLLPQFRAPLGPQDSFILAREMDDQSAVWGEAVAPNALRTALRLHRLAARHPRLAAVGKALMRLAG